MLGNSDKELFESMIDYLGKYLKAAGRISKEGFDQLSQYNGLLWSEITEQKQILERLLNNRDEGNKPEQSFSEQRKENGPIKLYDKMVEFLMKQQHVELHWVKIYSVKCPQRDYKDFQIKYYEHKDPDDQERNYILFGDTDKNFSIRKVKNEIVGDTSECFDFILNLRDKLEIY
ncbi:MAG: hypothetical protein ACOYWZ_05945 [Bacillota bacterium]